MEKLSCLSVWYISFRCKKICILLQSDQKFVWCLGNICVVILLYTIVANTFGQTFWNIKLVLESQIILC